MFKKLFRVLLMASSLSNLSACVVAPPSVSIGFPPIFVDTDMVEDIAILLLLRVMVVGGLGSDIKTALY